MTQHNQTKDWIAEHNYNTCNERYCILCFYIWQTTKEGREYLNKVME